MLLFDLIRLMDGGVTPQETKIHLATSNGIEDPLEVFAVGGFDDWQCIQTKKNFERPLVLGLIAMPGRAQWLYAGVYSSNGCEWLKKRERWDYDLAPLESCAEFGGRLVASFERPGRQSYLCAERWIESNTVAEIRAEPLTLAEFPGYRAIHLSKRQLDAIVRQRPESWRTALSNVAGVYLISVTASSDGCLYVGSASGEGGLWQRWCNYSETGHGGNRELRQLLKKHPEYASTLHFSLLEVADVSTGADDLLSRESHWKEVLLTRRAAHGLNAN